MEITKDTRVCDILQQYGDIANVMEVFGVQRVGRYSLRALATRALTVEWAARIHQAPLWAGPTHLLDGYQWVNVLRTPLLIAGGGLLLGG